MHYFFKPHEANFREWRKGRYVGIPDSGDSEGPKGFVKALAKYVEEGRIWRQNH